MSICQSGVACKVQPGEVLVDVNEKHPLVRLSQSLPWQTLVDTILPDLKKTKGGFWWLGRKLRVRIHLGVYLLQQLFKKRYIRIYRKRLDPGCIEVYVFF